MRLNTARQQRSQQNSADLHLGDKIYNDCFIQNFHKIYSDCFIQNFQALYSVTKHELLGFKNLENIILKKNKNLENII